jgi:cytochrome P450
LIASELRAIGRWTATHGLLRLFLAFRSRQGNTDAAILLDSEKIQDPFPHYERMRRDDAPLVDGAYCRVALHYEACSTMVRHADFEVAVKNELAPPLAQKVLRLMGTPDYIGPIDQPSLLSIDGAAHQRVRRLVSKAFTVRAVEKLRVYAEKVADELLTQMADVADDEIDLVQWYAGRLPLTVICAMLGIAPEMYEQILGWGEGATAALEIGLDLRHYLRGERQLAALNTWMLDHLRECRRNPGDNLLSELCGIVDGTDLLSEQELLAAALVILAAGFETTVHLLAGGAQLLMRHPEQHDRLVSEPALWPNAVDEILRLESPVQRTVRRAVRDSDALGVHVDRGEYFVAILGAANRDPQVFAKPDQFDVARENARQHLTFSGGQHFCLGAALARLEGEVALRALFERFPAIRPARQQFEFRQTRTLRGIKRLPVVLGDPAF